MTDYEKFKKFFDEIGIPYKECKTEYSRKGCYSDPNNPESEFSKLVKEIDNCDEPLPYLDLSDQVLGGYELCDLLFTPKSLKFLGVESE